jgi:hypothetical protein
LELLETLLATLANFCHTNTELKSFEKFWGISGRCNFFSCEVDEVVSFLGAIISSPSSQALPPCLIAEIHSCIGMISAEQNRLASAIRSLLTTLWIQKSAKDIEVVDIAVTKHRLALIYGRSYDYAQAVCLLEKALSTYDRANMKHGHSCRIQAQASLEKMQRLKLQQCLALHPKAAQLSHILEVDEAISEAFTVTLQTA